MGSIDTNQSLNISLPPPDPNNNNQNLVVSLKTNQVLGSGTPPPAIGNQLTAVFGQDVDTMSEAQKAIDKLNINLQLGGSLQNAEQAMQQQLDGLTPDDPEVPILGKYIQICDELLQGGSVPGVNFTLGLNTDGSVDLSLDADNVASIGAAAGTNAAGTTAAGTATVGAAGVTSAPKANLSGTVGGNPFLAGNAYVAFVISYMALAKLMMQNMMVENKNEINSMQMVYELGNLSADQIEQSGQKAAEMHRIAAITAAVSATTIAVSTGISAGAMMKNKMEPEPEGDVYTPMKREHQVGDPSPDYNPPPNLNKNGLHPVKDPLTGNQEFARPPKYVEYKGKIYRNEPAPPGVKGDLNVEGGYYRTDGQGHAYLPPGQQPVLPNKDAGIVGVNPNATAKLQPDGSYKADPYTLGSDDYAVKPIPRYEQMKVGPKQTGVDAHGNPKYEEPLDADGNQPQYAIRTKSEVRADNEIRSQKTQYYSLLGNSFREFSAQTSKSVEEFINSGLELQKAQADALKEIYSTLSRLAGNALDRAIESFKNSNDMLTQTIQQLDQIRQKLQEAINGSLKRSA